MLEIVQAKLLRDNYNGSFQAKICLNWKEIEGVSQFPPGSRKIILISIKVKIYTFYKHLTFTLKIMSHSMDAMHVDPINYRYNMVICADNDCEKFTTFIYACRKCEFIKKYIISSLFLLYHHALVILLTNY